MNPAMVSTFPHRSWFGRATAPPPNPPKTTPFSAKPYLFHCHRSPSGARQQTHYHARALLKSSPDADVSSEYPIRAKPGPTCRSMS